MSPEFHCIHVLPPADQQQTFTRTGLNKSYTVTLARQKVLDFHATYSSWFNCSFISTFMQLNQRILFSYVTLLSNLVLHPRLISISSLLMNLSSQKLP